MIYLLPHTILNSAQRFPHREAFRCGNQSRTFTEMADQMHQLADQLIQLGLEKGDRVGIYLNRSIETAIAIYGIMRAGGVYVPLDPKSPTAQTQFLIDNCQISIIISNSSQRRNLKKVVEQSPRLKTIIGAQTGAAIQHISWEDVQSLSSDFEPPFKIIGDDLAYIMYTSGSTGTPKGIMHTHNSGLAYAKLSAELFQLTENDRIGNHAPIHFDISTMGYFTAPLVGATTVIVTDAHTILPASLSQLIEKERLTLWYAVPLSLIQIIQNDPTAPQRWNHLRWILYGGEPFPPKYLRNIMSDCPQAQVSNIYGPAEVNQCTYFHIPGPLTDDQPIPIGYIWNNTEGLILTENNEEGKINETGELLIRGATQMQGYWNNPELTDKAWYWKTQKNGPAEKYFRTGDLVKLDEKGLLHFLGRKDHQVKIRGFRVELDAVESALVAHPEVLEAAVYARQKTVEMKTIEAAVILKNNKIIEKTDLLIYLKAKLPYYAVPEQIFVVDDFPRTSSGKIKRSAVAASLKN